MEDFFALADKAQGNREVNVVLVPAQPAEMALRNRDRSLHARKVRFDGGPRIHPAHDGACASWPIATRDNRPGPERS